ncbi:MAG: 50S ribosomal protein L9 [Patescibacteria group bacterium]
MKVILLKDVRNVGAHGAVCEVADGFARNYLFTHKLAEPATEEKMAQVVAQAAARAADEKKRAEELDKKVASLNGKTVTLTMRSTPQGGLFKAVAPKDISAALRLEHSLEIPEGNITIAEPIKTVGGHHARLESASHKADLGVVVAAA